MGDALDALLCALQAAWAYTQREQGYEILSTCDALEGCIVDPQLSIITGDLPISSDQGHF